MKRREPVTVAERTLPHSLDAERSVLGASLLAPDAYVLASEVIEAADLFRDAHRRIWDHLGRLSAAGSALDLLTLRESLQRSGELEECGGPAYIASLVDGVPRSTNVEHYARVVREKSLLRQVIFACNATLAKAYDPGDQSTEEVVHEAEQRIYEVASASTSGAGMVDSTVIERDGRELLQRLQTTGRIAGIGTGLVELDASTRGLHRQQLVIAAARPGGGKSAFALGVAEHVAITTSLTVGMFSLEMSREEIALRLMSRRGRVNAHALASGHAGHADYERIDEALTRIGQGRLWVDDMPGRTVLQIRSLARRLKARFPDLALLVVDYLQLVTAARSRRQDSRTQEVADITRGLKLIAKELNVPVLALSQLTRDPEKSNRRPKLSDLRESGSIEQDADQVWFIHLPDQHDGTALVIVAKQRNGPPGPVKVAYEPSQFRFDNLAEE